MNSSSSGTIHSLNGNCLILLARAGRSVHFHGFLKLESNICKRAACLIDEFGSLCCRYPVISSIMRGVWYLRYESSMVIRWKCPVHAWQQAEYPSSWRISLKSSMRLNRICIIRSYYRAEYNTALPCNVQYCMMFIL